MHICTYSHILTHISIYMHIYICMYIYICTFVYVYIYSYMNIQSAKNHTTNMCLCICFGMHVFSCIFQHLPTTPPHQLNPTNPIPTTKPKQLTHPALPSIYNNNHTISGGVPPPSPTHPPIFLLFNYYVTNHILPPTYMLPLWWLAFLAVV